MDEVLVTLLRPGPGLDHCLKSLREIEWRASSAYASLGYDVSHWLVKSTEELRISAEEGRLWVANSRRASVGFALVQVEGSFVHLEEIDVEPKWQRRGVGEALLKAVLASAFAREGCEAVTLRVFRTAPWAMRLYRKIGFVEISSESDLAHVKKRIEAERAAGFKLSDRVTLAYRRLGY